MKILVSLLILSLCPFAFAATGTIQDISFRSDKNVYGVLVSGEGNLECNTVFMDNPLGIALDFPDVKNKFYPKSIQLRGDPYINNIKTSQYSKGKVNISRVLVELKAPIDYNVSVVPEGVLLKLAPKRPNPIPGGNVPRPSVPGSSKSSPAPVRNEIVIGAEDLIVVSVFDLPQFSGESRVGGDGTITLPLVGSVEIRGLTKKEAELKIAEALQQKYVNNANVSVTIKEYKSRQVSILGAVKNPGPYYILSPRTLLQVLSEVGGIMPEAGSKCFIFRAGRPRMEIDLNDLMTNGNQNLNVPILPGDTINIPVQQKIIIYVLGSVKTPGAIEMPIDQPVTLVGAIARAGGTMPQASSKLQIRRKDATGAESIIKANIKDIMAGKKPDIPLINGDVINVPESFF